MSNYKYYKGYWAGLCFYYRYDSQELKPLIERYCWNIKGWMKTKLIATNFIIFNNLTEISETDVFVELL